MAFSDFYRKKNTLPVMGMNHCICNFITGAAKHFDMPDLAGMIAPRPILIEGGTQDPIFPIKATRSSIAEIRKVYHVWGSRAHVHSDIFEGDHQWSGRKMEMFLGKYL